MPVLLRLLVGAALLLCGCPDPNSEEIYDPTQSVARNWNESLLAAIRNDLARPTVHARNLFHSSALMFDLWAVYSPNSAPFFLGHPANLTACALTPAQRSSLRETTQDIEKAREVAISHGMYRLLTHRFGNSVGRAYSLERFRALHETLGHDSSFDSSDFEVGTAEQRAAALGNYVANCVIEFGLGDGANEGNRYANRHYTTTNKPLDPTQSGNPDLEDPNRWQPLEIEGAIDQAGNPVASILPFLSPEWGSVVAFAIPESARTTFSHDNATWTICHDPGPPARLRGPDAAPAEYQWNHSLVAYWSSHLDPTDGVEWDISPASLGNTAELPTDLVSLRDFYDSLNGGVRESGHAMNPITGAPYAPNVVPRGDYTRVLAEFWADGPDSETPPGHWFVIANTLVNDHPQLVRRYRGKGDFLNELEWDVKLYFALGAAMHDSAVTAWGIKGWYDYIRPISAIRFMASKGQSSDPNLPNYDIEGMPLEPGFVELVEVGDPLAGNANENVGRIKIKAWRGPSYIENEEEDAAGVGWILAADWWPYQRPSFVTPPFAGYVSGHSTFSRAAAEILTAFTGSEYFPGGLGEYVARKNEFLVFEQGPSVDIKLQWATYRDASDQTSLSRIWGGIHPPVDDVPGRRLGITIAADVMSKVDTHFGQ